MDGYQVVVQKPFLSFICIPHLLISPYGCFLLILIG
uniref:Uncharacterized protein n=1 Tax=Manihot esculenta TaxID=3983 RepID=A0A2C9UHG9_MANES